MSLKESEFWRDCEKYHNLAESFERNIELLHPNIVTSKRMCPCLEYCNYCGWASSSVNYYEYRGERI